MHPIFVFRILCSFCFWNLFWTNDEALVCLLQENCPEEKQNKYNSLFIKMASSFADPCKAEECFQKLNNMKDNNIFNMLTLLLDDLEHMNAQITRVRSFSLLSCLVMCLLVNSILLHQSAVEVFIFDRMLLYIFTSFTC